MATPEPSSTATLKTWRGVVIERHEDYVVVETTHKQEACRRISMTAQQCKGTLPGLFVRGRVYCVVSDESFTWFFSPDKRVAKP
jgi:hypothetical protein